MAQKQETLSLFRDVLDSTRKLSDAQFGVLMRAAFAYRFEGQGYIGDDVAVDMAFQFIVNQIDRYQLVCNARSQAASERWKKANGETEDANCTNGHNCIQKVQASTPILSYPIQDNIVEKLDVTRPLVQEIVDYLNEKSGTSYRAGSKKTASLIQARLKEGFTVDDFKTVIDRKVTAWRSDGAMCRYLRPETLFGTKFEGYLNEPSPSQPTTTELEPLVVKPRPEGW